MATMPTYPDGTLIDPDKWNAHANQINANTSAIATNAAGLESGNTRITTLETNQGTRGSHGAIYTEINTLKNKRACILRKSANQSIAQGGDVELTWATEVVNVGGMRSGNRIIVPAGRWHIQLNVRFEGNAGGTERNGYLVDATGLSGSPDMTQRCRASVAQAPMNGGVGNAMQISWITQFTSATTISGWVFQNSTGAINVSPVAFGGCQLSVVEL